MRILKVNKILNYYMYYFCVDLLVPNDKAHKGNTIHNR